jgi:hypothetical protein
MVYRKKQQLTLLNKRKDIIILCLRLRWLPKPLHKSIKILTTVVQNNRIVSLFNCIKSRKMAKLHSPVLAFR